MAPSQYQGNKAPFDHVRVNPTKNPSARDLNPDSVHMGEVNGLTM